MDVFEKIENAISGYGGEENEISSFYHFEPWDVEKRPEWMLEMARGDGIDLHGGDIARFAGIDPHPFQSGYLQSTAFMRTLLAGTSVGKSYVALMEGIIQITGETPISMRYDAGVDTKVKRVVNEGNILRFGRFDARSGAFIDHNTSAQKDETEWNCGTIRGVGKYPTEKIAPYGSELWLGTYMKAMNEYWWPRLYDEATRIIPDHLIDKNRGHNGFSVQDKIVYLSRGGKLAIITYETGYNRFEAQRVWSVILDEEPEDERIFGAAQQRCKWLSLVETPYRGMTYTKGLIFDENSGAHKRLFHATQYDSPYQRRELIDIRRQNMRPWDIGARIWGIHSEMRGKPYYDRHKITTWMNKYKSSPKLVSFRPSCEYNGIVSNGGKIPSLLDVDVSAIIERELDKQGVWSMYEDVRPNVPYVLAADPAEGSENPEEAADICAAVIARPPYGDETGMRIVATLRSTLETILFARVCSHAARYYNNSNLAAETRRAACNAAFAIELRDWPYWYKMTSVQQSNRMARSIRGFDTNVSTRSAIFEMIQGWIAEYGFDEYPQIPDRELLKELAACVVGKNGRPDHTRDGTLDTTICFGILLYVFKNSPEQITYNGDESPTNAEPFGKLRGLIKSRDVDAAQCRNAGLGALMPHWRK